MQVKNNSERLYTVNGVRIIPGATETVNDPDGVWAASIAGCTELEIIEEVAKRGRPAKTDEEAE